MHIIDYATPSAWSSGALKEQEAKWTPLRYALLETGALSSAQGSAQALSGTDEAQLKASFGLYSDGAIRTDSEDFVSLMRALDIDVADDVRCTCRNNSH